MGGNKYRRELRPVPTGAGQCTLLAAAVLLAGACASLESGRLSSLKEPAGIAYSLPATEITVATTLELLGCDNRTGEIELAARTLDVTTKVVADPSLEAT